MSPTEFPRPSPDSPLVVLDPGALVAASMAQKPRGVWILADDEPFIGLPTIKVPRRRTALQDYRPTENFPLRMNVVPFRYPIHRPLTRPAPAPSSSLEQLRFRAELRWLIYGVGMFVLGILAHVAWLKA